MAGPQAQRPISQPIHTLPTGLSEYAVQSGLPARRSGLPARRSSHEGTSALRTARPISQTSSGIGTTSVSGCTTNITTITISANTIAATTTACSSTTAGVPGVPASMSGTAVATTPTSVEQHIEITVDDDQNRDKDVEHGGKKVRHRHHRRPLYRRVINYIRHAWTGVKFSSSNGK